MKKIIYVSAILLAFQIGVAAQDECPGTLIHYWKLNSNNGGFTDHVGGLTAQIESAPLPILGVVDSGQYFTGLSEVSLPDDSGFDWDKNASFTIGFWINKSSGCPSNNSINNNVVIGRDDATTGLHWWIGVDCEDPGKINFTLLSNDGNGAIIKSHRNIIDADWHYITVVRNGEENTSGIYIDAELDTVASYSYSEGFGSSVPINMGWLNLNSKYHLDGSLDELAIHSEALSPSVIAGYYNGGTGNEYCAGIGTSVNAIEKDYSFDITGSYASSEIRVRFNLVSPEHVSVAIFDVSGRNLGYLVNEQVRAGNFDKTFRTEQFGRNTLLLIQARFANSTLTRKIILN